MKPVHLANSSLLAFAVLIGLALTGAISMAGTNGKPDNAQQTVEDATGAKIPVRSYSRIVSTSTIADQVLIELIEPRRLLAVSSHTLRTQASPSYRDKIGVEHARDIETIIELRPDIVFINNFVDRRQVERMKDAGLNVFDLGPMRGLETLLPNIRQLGEVLDLRDRTEAMEATWLRRLEAVSADLSSAERQRGLYVGIHGDRLYGGTTGTSFHDVLVAAGVDDLAAEQGFTGWPAFTNEQLLSLDPPWIITNPGTERSLCRHPGLATLSACRSGRVRSIATDLLTDPGLGMLDAAVAVHAAVYGGSN